MLLTTFFRTILTPFAVSLQTDQFKYRNKVPSELINVTHTSRLSEHSNGMEVLGLEQPDQVPIIK